MQELKPCPFCGNESLFVGTIAEIYEEELNLNEDSLWHELYEVVCDCTQGGCGASCGISTSAEGAVEVWNRRAVSPPHYLQHPVTDEQRDAHLHGLWGEEDNVDD